MVLKIRRCPWAIGATVSAGALHAQGWGFESLIAHHRFASGAMKAPFLFEMAAVERRGVKGRPDLRGLPDLRGRRDQIARCREMQDVPNNRLVRRLGQIVA